MLVMGCDGGGSSNTAHWQGTVTVDGQPLPGDAAGSITFRPVGSGTARAVTVQIENGKYDSPETPKGNVKAFFNIERPTGETYTSERTGEEVVVTESMVPETSAQGLDIEVTGNNADGNFDL
jgi:hypothetical protein